jgi:Pyruvate/2-oxoacid:ferredoxin oxidoreductase delta subunit
MGHVDSKGVYRNLQKRLDKNPIGAPESAVLYEILGTLFTEEEASIAAQMPFTFASTRRVAKILGLPEEEAQNKLESMAERGLLFDIERKGRSYWYLNPTVIGFFEFSMMRLRPDIDQGALANHLHSYFFEDPQLSFLREVGSMGDTQLFRPLVHEDPIADTAAEVLDYERATNIVENAGKWAVGMCHCRHVAEHKNEACDTPMEICLTLSTAADTLTRRGLAKEITKQEALDILTDAKERGLVQMGDNVKKGVMFICNCCSCCCCLLQGYRRLRDQTHVQTSNFEAVIASAECTRCGICVEACPVDAITSEGKGKQRTIDVALDYCLGCGVCATKCPEGAMKMEPREARVHTPENAVERVVRMSLERGKLQNIIFDDANSITHGALRMVVKAVLRLPPAKQLLASEQLRSKFVNRFLKLASNKPGADM